MFKRNEITTFEVKHWIFNAPWKYGSRGGLMLIDVCCVKKWESVNGKGHHILKKEEAVVGKFLENFNDNCLLGANECHHHNYSSSKMLNYF